MGLRTFDEVLQDYERYEKMGEEFSKTPEYERQIRKTHQVLFSEESMLAMAKDFFKDGYKNYQIWDYKDYAEASKKYIKQHNVWDSECQKAYDRIMNKYRQFKESMQENKGVADEFENT